MASIAEDFAAAVGWKNLADAHAAAGNFAAAAANYEGALRIRPDYLEARHNLGISLRELGELERSAECCREVLRLDPSCGAAYNSLGNILKLQGKPAEATEAYQQALRLLPDHAQVIYNLALVLHEQGRLDQAMDCYRRVLSLNPKHADASNNLATAFKEQGTFDEAVAQFQETLRIQPDHALAIYNLSELAAGGHFQFAPAELDRIKTCLNSEGFADVEKGLFCFTLATVLDKQGCYDEAFRYYQEANARRRRLLQEQKTSFDAQSQPALVERIMGIFDRAYFEKVAGWGLDTELPIFIIGMPRSGSTLVEQILASHPRVFGAGELGEIPRYLKELAQTTEGRLYANPVPLDRRSAQDFATGYIERITELGQGADRVTLKTLDNYLHLGIIATLFPRARIIHCRRDPLDLCLSCFFQNFQTLDFAWSLEDIGGCYQSYQKLMAHWAQVLPVAIHEVCYEDLIQNQGTVSRELLAFCGLDWDERCLTFYNTRRPVLTASNVQVRNPLSTQSIGRWKNYQSYLGPLCKALGLQDPRGTETSSSSPETHHGFRKNADFASTGRKS